MTDGRLQAGRTRAPQPGGCLLQAQAGRAPRPGRWAEEPRSCSRQARRVAWPLPGGPGVGRQSCRQPLWSRSSNRRCSGEDQGLKAWPDELLRLKFSMLALRIRLVFLEVSAKAIQTFPKTRLGKNKAALPKLYIFPAFRESFEEQTDLHSSELEPSGCLGVVLHSRRGLLLSANVHPSLGGDTTLWEPRFTLLSLCCRMQKSPLARNADTEERAREGGSAAFGFRAPAPPAEDAQQPKP